VSLYIGIEGIGMRISVAVAADESGEISAVVRKPWGISLHSTPRPVLRERLYELFQCLAQDLGRKPQALGDATVCVGLTGVTFPYDARIDLTREISELPLRINRLICTGDAEISFASHAREDTGSAILCHMGSTAYAVVNGLSTRVGGWGPALGDEGSGFWMGRAAIRAIAEEYDDKSSKSPLWQEVESWLCDPRDDLNEWGEAAIRWRGIADQFASAGDEFDIRTALFAFSHELSLKGAGIWRQVASGLTIPLMRAWQKGYEPAASIVRNAARELATQYIRALEIARMEHISAPLVLYGGVMTHNPQFRDLVLTELKDVKVSFTKVLCAGAEGTMRPACGALLFALGGSTTGDLKLPRESVRENVFWSQVPFSGRGGLRND